MTGPKKLKPWKGEPTLKITQPPTPRCEAGVQETSWNWRRQAVSRYNEGQGYHKDEKYAAGRLDQCTKDAVVEIDGVPYCRLHGGQVVLDMYVEGKLVKK